LVLLLFPPVSRSADPKWIKARFGAFEAISDDGRRSATQALSQFEQISFALGTVMGVERTAQPDLRLDPPLRIIVFKDANEMAGQCPNGLVMGRDRLMACTTSEGQLPRELLRQLTRKLLETNFAKMPAPIETALETFFSTVESNAVHVTWGAPPPVAERTREWALLHRIITQADLTGKAKIYLHNLAVGMDAGAAGRNAFGEDAAKFNADVDRYFAAGVFNTAVAPNRPINPDRDLNTTFLTSDEGDLARADLLTPASPAIYQSLLQSGKRVAEANEGLAILAMRANDAAKARTYMEAARKAGTRNFVALTTYANLESDPAKAIEILKEALTLDPKYAEAHWAFGEKLGDPARRLAEWKQAVNLAPRNNEWWAKYAQLCVEQKQYAEAGRAWVAAAQAAPNVQLREQYLTARGQIEQQRLDAEDIERRRDAAAKATEINRLKNEARQELAQLEARANTRPLSAEDRAKTVEWFDDSNAPKVAGNLMRVDCAGKQLRLSLRRDDGQTVTLVVPDTQQLEIKSGETISCGAQKARHVTIAYKAASKADAAKGVTGEVISMDFAR
jgi:tetratricopeptide (TPR) repeat protein